MRFGAVLTVCLVGMAATASAAVMGIDYGSEFIKIAAPKKNNIDIVLNEQSHRKTHNYIGFRKEERFFAEDAKNLAPRFPDNMFTYFNHLVGVPFNDTERKAWFREVMHHTAQLEEAVKPTDDNTTEPVTLGTTAMRTGANPNTTYHAETLLGMMFGYVRSLVKKDTGSKLRDAAVTIPAATTLRQRQGIIDAAALAGVNVIGTIHVTTAVALQYGLKNQGFGNQTFRLMVFDMGAAHTDVGVYTFKPPAVGKGKKLRNAEALGSLETNAIVSDVTLGGRAFDSCLAELIEQRFVEATKLPKVLTAETLAKRKAVIALLRAGNKAKEVLSANKVATVVAEAMAPNRDFPTKITREEFEEHCDPLFKRANALVDEVASKAGIEIQQVDALELSGGASRIPKLIDELSAKRGKPVDRTLNTDESAAIGAAFYGGVSTKRFRVKSFSVNESLFTATPQASSIVFALSPKKDGDALTFRTLFPSHSRLGQLKTVTVNRTANFNVTLAYVEATGNRTDSVIRVSGIEQGLQSVKYYADLPDMEGSAALGLSQELNHPNNSHSIRIEFRATESGIISVETAELRINYVANVTRQVKVNLTTDELEAERNMTVNRVTERFVIEEAARSAKRAPDNSSTNVTEDSDQTGVNTTSDSANATEINATDVRLQKKIAKALKSVKAYKFIPETTEEMKRTVLALKTKSTFTFPSPLTRGDKKRLRQILEDFDFEDEQRRLLAKAKNDLEAYLYHVKTDGVLENDELKEAGVLTDEVVESVEAVVQNVSTWIEDAPLSTPREEYEQQLASLKNVVRPLEKQLKRAKQEPASDSKVSEEKPTDSDVPEASTETAEEDGSAESAEGSGAEDGSATASEDL